jgi:hypothetical protein
MIGERMTESVEDGRELLKAAAENYSLQNRTGKEDPG